MNNQITIAENLSVIPVITTNAPHGINAEVGFPRNWGIITLPYYYTGVNCQAQDERAKLFGSWKEIGDEDETLKEIYESRLIPSTFKSEEKLKKHIKRLAIWLRTHIFHGEYDMDIIYVSAGETNPGLDCNSMAGMRINSKYLTCSLIVSMEHLIKRWNDGDDVEIMRVLTHEFSHLLTEPLYDFAIDATTNSTKEHLESIRERQTQRISNVIMQGIPPSIYKRAK